MLAGFAFLLYVDNYGQGFSWRMLFSRVTLPTTLLAIIAVLLAVNLYFVWGVYRPIRLKVSGKELDDLSVLAKRSWTFLIFIFLLVGALALLVIALPATSAWTMAVVVAGVLLPILFTENYAVDLFWNQNRRPESVDSLGI